MSSPACRPAHPARQLRQHAVLRKRCLFSRASAGTSVPPEYAARLQLCRPLCRSLSAACRAVSGLPRAEAEAVSATVARLLDSGAGGKAKGAAAAPPPTGAPGVPVQGSLWRAAAASPGPPLPLLPPDAAALLSGLVPCTAPPDALAPVSGSVPWPRDSRLRAWPPLHVCSCPGHKQTFHRLGHKCRPAGWRGAVGALRTRRWRSGWCRRCWRAAASCPPPPGARWRTWRAGARPVPFRASGLRTTRAATGECVPTAALNMPHPCPL